MNCFKFDITQNVLLLGEGNFSFSCCLLKVTEELYGLKTFSNVYSTCFQKGVTSDTTLENIIYLKKRGAVIFPGIDATKLENEHLLKGLKFDKIIFNFPHVGGKMKIHLNRQLLRDFFVSVTSVLISKGEVIVTLCSGQGGTDFEGVQRRWDDTWQIVEQAAQGDFVLVHVDNFPSELFKEYKSVGYRGLEKSFNTKEAVVHVFTKVTPLLTEIIGSLDLLNEVPLENNENIFVSVAHKRCIKNDPFRREGSPQSFLTQYLVKSVKCFVEDFIIFEHQLALYTDFISTQPYCRINGVDRSLRISLIDVLPEGVSDGNLFLKGLVFEQFQTDFNNLAKCEAVIKSGFTQEIMKHFLSNIINTLNSHLIVSEEAEYWYLRNNSMKTLIAVYDNVWNAITIYIDVLASCLFSVSCKELWATGCQLSKCNGYKVILPSLCHRSYIFHICVVSKDILDMSKFFYILRQLPEDIIEGAHLISSYELGNREKSYCFGIKYRSYSKPVFRKRLIEFHTNVVGKLLEYNLNVRIK